MTPEKHRKAIFVVGTEKLGKRTVLVMLCSGPDCGGARMLTEGLTAADVAAEAAAHIDKMAGFGQQ